MERETGHPVPEQSDTMEPFIDGYFSQRMKSGEKPNYGYPSNHVPKTTVKSMKVVPSFVAGLKKK